MQVFTIIYASLLSLVYTRSHVLDLSSQRYKEPVNIQVEKKSQNYIPEDGFLQLSNYRKSRLGQQLPQANNYEEQITDESIKPTTTVPKSGCKFWCVTSDNYIYCCDDGTDNDFVENDGICPLIRNVCPVKDVKLAMSLPREDDLHVPLSNIAKDEPCIISAEVLEHLRLFHNRIYNGNISTIEKFGLEHHRVSITAREEHHEELFGHYIEDFEETPYTRPIYDALYLTFRIGTLVKIVPYIPFITEDPARDLYSKKYKKYDDELLEEMLEDKKYESLMLSRIRRHKYNKPLYIQF